MSCRACECRLTGWGRDIKSKKSQDHRPVLSVVSHNVDWACHTCCARHHMLFGVRRSVIFPLVAPGLSDEALRGGCSNIGCVAPRSDYHGGCPCGPGLDWRHRNRSGNQMGSPLVPCGRVTMWQLLQGVADGQRPHRSPMSTGCAAGPPTTAGPPARGSCRHRGPPGRSEPC